MFTTVAFLALAGIGWLAQRSEDRERLKPWLFDDDRVRQSIMFMRQDVRLIVYLLAAILVMLGIIADVLLGMVASKIL